MSWNTFDVVLLRGVMPLLLLGASVVRYCGFSFIYLFMLLVCPLIRYDIRQKKPMTIYLVLLIILSGSFSITIALFHIPVIWDNKSFTNCSNSLTRSLYQVGVTNLEAVNYARIIRLVLPDQVVLISAIIHLVYLIKRQFMPPKPPSISLVTDGNNIRPSQLATSSGDNANNTDVNILNRGPSLRKAACQSKHAIPPQTQSENSQTTETNLGDDTITDKLINNDTKKDVEDDAKNDEKVLPKLVMPENKLPTGASNNRISDTQPTTSQAHIHHHHNQSNTMPQLSPSHQQQTNTGRSKPPNHDTFYHNYLEETFGINRLHKKIWHAWAMQSLFVTVNVVITGFAGIISPSILNSVYLFSFLGVCTYWALGNKVITPNFAYMRIFLLMYSSIHVSLLYICQIEFMQYYVPNGKLSSRLLGLYYLFDTSCAHKGEFIIQNQRWIDFMSPCVIVFVYYMYATETRRWFEKGSEGIPRVRSLKEDTNMKPSLSNDPELQHLIPETLGDHLPGSSGAGLIENRMFPAHPYQKYLQKYQLYPPHRQPHQCHKRHQSSTAAQNNYQTAAPAIPQSLSTSLPMINFPVSTTPSKQPLSKKESNTSVVKFDNNNLEMHPTTATTSETLVNEPIRNNHQDSHNNSRDVEAGDDDYVSDRFLNEDLHDEVICSDENCEEYRRMHFKNNHHHGPLLPSVAHRERPLMLSLINTAIRNSYVFTFIAMMAWSVTYKSWLTFILLLAACILWMMPDSRRACLYFSPLIVFYATALIILQYIYGFNLSELPTSVISGSNKIDLAEVGLQKFDIPAYPLAVMIGFLVIYWLTLRLFMNERSFVRSDSRNRSEDVLNEIPVDENSDADSEAYFGDVDNAYYLRIITFLSKICEKYWILVCCLAMLVVSIQSPNIFRIIYMIMLIYFQLAFMISYSFWRKQMYFFWWVVIVYSVIILLGIYTFQFKRFPNLWQNKTGLPIFILQDIGLNQYKAATLFQSLLTPVVFLVVIIVQVRYFHQPFLKLSSMKRFQNGNNREPGDRHANLDVSSVSTSSSNVSAFMVDMSEAFQILVEKLKTFFDNIYTAVWRFLEVHFTKIVSFLVMYACITEVSASNIVLIIIIVLCLPFPKLHKFLVTFTFLWCSLLVLLKMIYQLKILNPVYWSSNCTTTGGGFSNNTTIDNANYFGLMKVNDFQHHVTVWTAVLVSCSIWHAVRYHQRQYFNPCYKNKPPRGVIFEDVRADNLDDSLLTLLKFCLNYAFYKLGLELCFIVTVIVACLRVDVYSVVYLLLLLVFMCTPRKVCAKLWWFYLLILGILIPIQYTFCIGLPPGLCIKYPFDITTSLQQWLFIPSYYKAPVARKLMADFIQFLFVALQYQAFETEKNLETNNFGGGKNRPILNNELPKTSDKDFVSTKDSYVDYLKHVVFYWSYWLSLAVLFMTGVVWITLFCLGYMILAFIYLWLGQNVMLRKRTNLIASWNVIIYYNFFVILSKCAFQLMGCVYMEFMIEKNLCWLIQLFGVQCINPLSWNIPTQSIMNIMRPIVTIPSPTGCAKVETGLHWDVTCFLFLIMQRKIFMTKSFCHVVLDLNVQNRFASRGAYLINRKMMGSIRDQNEKEERVLQRIQRKIEKIQMRQAQHGKPELNEHYLVMRSGDYYLFEGDPEEDDLEIDNMDEDFHTKKALTFSEDNLTHHVISEEPAILHQLHEIPSAFDSGSVTPSPGDDQEIRHRSQSASSNSTTPTPANAASGMGSKFPLNTIRENSIIQSINDTSQLPIIHSDINTHEMAVASTSNVSLQMGQSTISQAPLYIQPITDTSDKKMKEISPGGIGDSESEGSSEEDDANPKKMLSTPMNPLQLINKAMEQGPRSAIREFKRTQSECRDPNISNTRRSSVHLGSRLESMMFHRSNAITEENEDDDDDLDDYDDKLNIREELLINDFDLSEQDEMSSLPDAYTTPPPAANISESNTDDSYHSVVLLTTPTAPQNTNQNANPHSGNSSGRTSITTGPIPTTTSTSLQHMDGINQGAPTFSNDNDRNQPSKTGVASGESAAPPDSATTNNAHGIVNMTCTDEPDLAAKTEHSERSLTTSATPKDPESCWSKFKASMIVFYLFIQSTADSLIILINGWTREARRISRTLDNEKKLVKRKVKSKINNEMNAKIELESIVMEIVGGDRNNNEVTNNPTNDGVPSQTRSRTTYQEEERRKEAEFRRSRSRFFLLAIAIGNVAIVYSEFVCYFLLIINHMLSGNLFSLPYPLMVFLWAMLSVPRPSKNFWIALITYTEIVIVLKYIFQFKFIELQSYASVDGKKDPLSIPRLIGIEKYEYYGILDWILLLFIFLHRGYLKNNGLWRDHTEFAQDLKEVDAEQSHDRPRSSCDEPIQQPSRRSCNPFYKIKRFYAKMTNPKFNKKVDVYVYMFLCEFISFLIIIFGYVSFGPGTDAADNAFDFIKTNKMPVPFVIMLITQFVFFIIDRALFLRKQVKGKFAFQIFHVLLIHAWLFFALPYITKKQFNSQVAPQLLYFVKCIYFALSAYQMKSGYPLRILGNFLTKEFNYLNLFMFKGYMIVPFLYELRNVMDWMWTDTAVALYHWMEMEDVFCKVFVLKCWRRSELEYPTPRGHTRRLASKYTVGILLLAFFFLCFWGPLTLSSFIGTTFVKNPPVKCLFTMSVEGYTPLYTFTSRGNSIQSLNENVFKQLKQCYAPYPPSTDYLQSFEAPDGTIINMDGSSADGWYISQPSEAKLLRSLKQNDTLNLFSQLTCERNALDTKSTEKIVTFTKSRELSDQDKNNIYEGITRNKKFVLKRVFPRFVTAYKRTLSQANQLTRWPYLANRTYLSVVFHKKAPNSTKTFSGGPATPWWDLQERRSPDLYCPNTTKTKDQKDIILIMFNERVSDNIFGHLFSNYGILGMYAAYIFVAHRVLRAFYSDISFIIRCEELPHVDRILNLLNEIYLVRENKMFRLEEQLIAKLIFLYRSSETMIKWTRHKRSIVNSHMESRKSNHPIMDIHQQQPPLATSQYPSGPNTIHGIVLQS